MSIYQSRGVLHYEQSEGFYKLEVRVDPSLALFYRALIPKAMGVTGQRYHPHISVVRNEIPSNLELWGSNEGLSVEFDYDTDIKNDTKYWWLNVFSAKLEAIREELGLQVRSPYTKPLAGFRHTFHITLGNTKSL